MTAALWGPGSGAPITLALVSTAAVGAATVALVARRCPGLVARLDRWLEDHL